MQNAKCRMQNCGMPFGHEFEIIGGADTIILHFAFIILHFIKFRRNFMYLSIGNDMAVRDRSIIGIFDLDNTTTSKRTREFLDKAEKDGEVVPCDDLPKSFVLTSEYGFTRVRLTSLNSATLEKRLTK